MKQKYMHITHTHSNFLVWKLSRLRIEYMITGSGLASATKTVGWLKEVGEEKQYLDGKALFAVFLQKLNITENFWCLVADFSAYALTVQLKAALLRKEAGSVTAGLWKLLLSVKISSHSAYLKHFHHHVLNCRWVRKPPGYPFRRITFLSNSSCRVCWVVNLVEWSFSLGSDNALWRHVNATIMKKREPDSSELQCI